MYLFQSKLSLRLIKDQYIFKQIGLMLRLLEICAAWVHTIGLRVEAKELFQIVGLQFNSRLSIAIKLGLIICAHDNIISP